MAKFPRLGDCFEDRFEILDHVASGGLSRIYRAKQLGLEREVALKILHPQQGADTEIDVERFEAWARRFEREARLGSQLRNPQAVTVHDFGRTDDGLWYIVFEFIDPSARFQSAREVHEALENLAAQVVDPDADRHVDASSLTPAASASSASASSLIDPNLAETEEAFGGEASAEPDIAAAAAALQEDRAKSAAVDTPRASTASSRPMSRERVLGLESEDGHLRSEANSAGAGESSDRQRPGDDGRDREEAGGNEAGGTEKVSELTMLGVEEMLRRSEHDGGRGFGWVVAALVATAFLGGLGYLVYSQAGSFSVMPQAARELANEWVIHPVSDSVAPENRFSIRGLQLAIESADWLPVGDEGVVESVDARTIMQTYGHNNHRVHAAFHDLSDRAAARKVLGRTELPARAVRCDTQVVVLEPATAAEEDHVEGLSMLLEDYRKAVLEAPEETALSSEARE